MIFYLINIHNKFATKKFFVNYQNEISYTKITLEFKKGNAQIIFQRQLMAFIFCPFASLNNKTNAHQAAAKKIIKSKTLLLEEFKTPRPFGS